MHSTDDDIHNLTEADRTSHTRFGPRPVPKGHKTASPYPHRPMRSSRIIPSAPMSPDGREAYPAPGLSAKIIVWGGVALGVAGLTAGGLMAARKLAGSDDEDRTRRHDYRRRDTALAPQFAELDEDDQERLRRRVRARARDEDRRAAKMRAGAAGRRSASQGNIARELTDTANDLSGSLNNVAQSLVAAFHGFRSVAAQANGIVSEFVATADQLRNLMDRGRPSEPDAASPPRDGREHRTHRL
ncbi:hypothetical protein JHW45_07855 [Paracoccus stylophorae]|uniref:Uncharacterized protein n=1 Tax=Paracoccus stylophorae TaxID=659350 RepID=A0ABY7SYT6_9RHOB|nr:hypothetical protein [Paracoccus stylophorae]WCR12225.1 hypothetical protein JHW45_07855 [Paracoccus stylophorae]